MSRPPMDVGDIDPNLEVFARRFQAARHAAGLSQEELSQKTGIGEDTISAIEGMSTNPSMLAVLRLADGIGIPAHRLFEDEPVA